MKCLMCDNPVTGKAVTCSPTCRKKLSRQKETQRKDPQLPETLSVTPDREETHGKPQEEGSQEVEERVSPVQAPQSSGEQLTSPEAPVQNHATRCSEDTPGAVWRSLVGKKGEWVIPGAHFIGKVDPLWSSCLNPDCPTALK